MLAAISLARQGGGVAAVSRLLQTAMREIVGADHLQVVELVPAPRATPNLDSGIAARFRFGLDVVRRQLSGNVSWVLFSHLAVARVQAVLPRRLRKPYGIFIHGIEIWRPLTAVETRVLSGASLRLANSRFTARRVESMHPAIGPVHVCPLSLEPGEVHRETRSARIVPTVLIVARVMAGERYKGHDQLIESWPAVRSAVPDAQLVIVGDGDDLERLKVKASQLGVADAVVFTGFVTDEDLALWYARSSVFAMPSHGEGFGLVYLEAMAYGLPCIGSDHDAASEIIVDGVTGFIVRQDDIATLSERMVQLLSDRPLRERMGANGYARLHSTFSYAQFVRRLSDAVASAFPTAPVATTGQPNTLR